MSYSCTDGWSDLIGELEHSRLLALSKRASEEEGPNLSTDEALLAIRRAGRAVKALRALIDAHDETPAMLTASEWAAARRAIKKFPN
jgi:hypothetical protein